MNHNKKRNRIEFKLENPDLESDKETEPYSDSELESDNVFFSNSNSSINSQLNSFVSIKKSKIDNQVEKEIDDLGSIMDKFNINYDFYQIDLDLDFNINLNQYSEDSKDSEYCEDCEDTCTNNSDIPKKSTSLNDNDDKIPIQLVLSTNQNTLQEEQIKRFNDKLKLIKQNMDWLKNVPNIKPYSELDYQTLCVISNQLALKLGKEKIIEGVITDIQFTKLIWKFISYKIYPTFIFENFMFDNNIKELFVQERNSQLDIIYPQNLDMNYPNYFPNFVPSWKRKYNLDIDYNLKINPINLRISRNFLKKILTFYEVVHNFYFDIIVGELLSWILSNYKINVNPFDEKFNKILFEDWVEQFNKVIINCKIFFKDLYLKYRIFELDDLEKSNLESLITQLKIEFVIDYLKTGEKIDILFLPLEKFRINIKLDPSSFSSSNCLERINEEINQIFRIKQYYKILISNHWSTQFIC